MDMFHAPTFLEGPCQGDSMLHRAPETDPKPCVVSSIPNPPASTPFTIFQDEDDSSPAAPPEKSKPVNVLADLSGPKTDRPIETASESIPDETATWGGCYNSLRQLDACPNSTTDFAPLAQCVSTPFTHKSVFSSSFQTQENSGSAEENFYLRQQTKKLSPIMEQSPTADSANAGPLPSSSRQGTIMADGFTSSCTSSSLGIIQPPAMLSFREQTLCPTQSDGSGWEVCPSPERRPEPASQSQSFKILEDSESVSPERVQNRNFEVPMSPESAPSAACLDIRSHEATTKPDLDSFLTPPPLVPAEPRPPDVPMSPEPQPSCADAPVRAQGPGVLDEPMPSPDSGRGGQIQPESDPWDLELISDLLGRLNPPLTSHPRCKSWPCRVPCIEPKITLSVGNSSLRVDCIIEKGASAMVYLATDPRTAEMMVLKVQKPANPWEFYINTCLDARLQPAVRHLFSRIHSAHLFQDGSVMLGELHKYGTLLVRLLSSPTCSMVAAAAGPNRLCLLLPERCEHLQIHEREGYASAPGPVLQRLHPKHGGAAAQRGHHPRQHQARQLDAGKEIPGRQRLQCGQRGPRPRPHRPRQEHRHAALTRRHGVHRTMSDLRPPGHRDAQRETVDLPGNRPLLVITMAIR
uniref:Mitotic checkpoint serine/threonine-protein kinase BUB1-like n=1 Tax=Cyprinodon variegatus TaxID=28743 RepID=A0A3Q2FLC9_CYPVA